MTQIRSSPISTFGILPGAARQTVVVLVMVLSIALTAPARAQCPAGWLPGQGVPGMDAEVNAFAVLPGGDLIVGGVFTHAGGVEANRIARYNPTTGVWSPLGIGLNNAAQSLAVLPGGDLIVGGVFTTAGGVAAQRIARYNPTTGVWSALGSGVATASGLAGGLPSVLALAVMPGGNGDVIVGGDFLTAGGVAGRNFIARYNPGTGVWSGAGAGTDGIVYALLSTGSGEVIVGGEFTSAGGTSGRNNIARYNSTLGIWAALGSGTDGIVHALALRSGGDVVVGGAFGIAGGIVDGNNIARVNPLLGTWSAFAIGTSGRVRSLVCLPGGDVVAGGDFTLVAGVTGSSRIARYSASAGAWTSVGGGIGGQVRALTVLPGTGGDIFAGGSFGTAGGLASSRFARFTFAVTPPPSISIHPSPARTCRIDSAMFSVTPGGIGPFTYQWRKGGVNLDTLLNPSAATAVLNLSGVQFGDAGLYDCFVTTACGSATSNAALLTVCPADFDCDGEMNFFDYLDFVDAFSSQNLIADYNHDSVVDFFDYLDFVDGFSIGC